MTTNPIFKLISMNSNGMQALGHLEKKKAQSSHEYYMLTPKEEGKGLLNLGAKTYLVTSYHFSIYDNLSEEEGNRKTSYHTTLTLSEDNKTTLTARGYFNNFGNLLYINVKNSSNVILKKLEVKEVEQSIKSYNLRFHNQIWKIYLSSHQIANEKYNKLLTKLTEQSAELDKENTLGKKKAAWESYSDLLKGVMEQIQKWNLFELNPDRSTHRYLRRLQKSTSKNFAHILSEHTSQLNGVEQQLGEFEKNNLPPWKKLAQWNALLSKKIDLLSRPSTVLNCQSQIEKNRTAARREFYKIMIGQINIPKADLEKLIAMIKDVSIGEFMIATNNNHALALTLLRKHHPHVNLEVPYKNTNKTLLQLAYDSNYTDAFETLLSFGIFCDTKYEDNTLLIQACIDRREKEMIALLKARASWSLRGRMGFSPFGILTMEKSKMGDKNTKTIKSFIKNCQNHYIDFMQGPSWQLTPLSFACQQGWEDIAKILVDNGACASAIRFPDKNTCLDVCVQKRHHKILKYILENSKKDISVACYRSLLVAKKFKNKSAIETLQAYMKKHNIKKKIGFVVPVGTYMSNSDSIMRSFS